MIDRLKKFIYSALLIAFCSVQLQAQNSPADSLKNLLQKERTDSNKVKLLLELADCVKFSDPESSYKNIQKALELSRKTKYKRYTHSAYRILGIIYATTGKLDSSKIAFNQSLEEALKYGSQSDIGNS